MMTMQNTTIDDYDDDDPLDENKNMSSQVPVSFLMFLIHLKNTKKKLINDNEVSCPFFSQITKNP